MPEWAIAIIALIAGFLLNVLYESSKNRKKTRSDNLKTHLKEIKISITNRMSDMARSIQIRHHRLVYGNYAPIQNHYDFFENQESYEGFKIHFKEFFEEWERLNLQAVEYGKKLEDFFQFHNNDNALIEANNKLKPIQQELINFAKCLTDTIDDIEKYQKVGKDFKYNRKCPICKKF